MTESADFGFILLVCGAGLLIALLACVVASRLPVPTAGILLLAAAVAATLSQRLHDAFSILDVERIATVALILVLFDGGASIGWRRFRTSWVPIASLGVAGTFLTACLMAVFAHALFGFGWLPAFVLGAALCPTDPAVMFSVLRGQEIAGRTRTILEGESGANDPVSIALMIGLLEMAREHGTPVVVVTDFVREVAIGLAIGVAGGLLLRLVSRRVLPDRTLYALRDLAFALTIYGVAAVAHGSGFTAVFVAGIILGDLDVPQRREVERFNATLTGMAEIVVFLALGLTIDLTTLDGTGVWLDGALLALLLAAVARPLGVGPLLLPVRLEPGERLFVVWSGLKGAVPILLGTYALLSGIAGGERIYGIVFVVVLLSVIVQGGSIPWALRRLRVPLEGDEEPARPDAAATR